MTFAIFFTLALVALVLAALARNLLPVDALMVGAMVVVMLSGIVTPAQALAGFANPGPITVAALYIVAAALRDTGAVYWIAHHLLGHPRGTRTALARLVFPTGLLSAFLNNTTVVALMMPAVQEWASRLRLPPSRLLLPLSYAAILGGTCTLIGTSTNLIVNGLMLQSGMPGFSIFDITALGLAVLAVGGGFMILFGQHFLPVRDVATPGVENRRTYRVEMTLPAGSALHGKTIRQSGLLNLAHGTLTDIHRADQPDQPNQPWQTPVPDLLLAAGDRLAFVATPEGVRELQRVNGMAPMPDIRRLGLAAPALRLVEAAVGADFPGLGQTPRACAFRNRYQAIILGISRNGRHLPGAIADIALQHGDILLLETDDRFVRRYRFRRDFLLISPLADSAPPDFAKAPLAVGLLLAMVAANAVGLVDVLPAAFLACAALLATGCIHINRARQSLSDNLPVLVVIGASFALGAALEHSGAAAWLVRQLFGGLQDNPWLALAGIYLMTCIVTELITNNAAAVMMFPLAINMSAQTGASPTPFIVAVMFAASASFLTPIGYQTNLMVMAPGGYRPADYLRFGAPLTLLVALTTIALIPLFWPFS